MSAGSRRSPSSARGSLSTAEVRERLGRSSAQSVHVLRSRGQLIGRTIGNATWFPAWQLQGGGLRDDLPSPARRPRSVHRRRGGGRPRDAAPARRARRQEPGGRARRLEARRHGLEPARRPRRLMPRAALPVDRPDGLSLLGLPTRLHVLAHRRRRRPRRWTWEGFPSPRHRFDPADGSFRTRYASTRFYGAARERYLDSGRYIPAAHADHHVVVARRHPALPRARPAQRAEARPPRPRRPDQHQPRAQGVGGRPPPGPAGARLVGPHRRHRLPGPHHARRPPRTSPSGRSTGARRRRAGCGTAPRSSTTSSSAATSRSTSTGARPSPMIGQARARLHSDRH